MTSEAELEALLVTGESDRCLDFLASLEAKERRSLAPLAKKKFKEFEHGEFVETQPGTHGWQSAYSNQQRECARLALIATCTEAELPKIADARTLEHAVEVWERMRPDFLPRAAELVMSASPYNFRVAFDLVQQGLSERPKHPNYALGLVGRTFRPFRKGDGRTLAEYVLTQPGVLEHDVWLLFEVEGSGELSVAAHDKYSQGDHTWSTALLTLMQEGHLDRGRLIDAALGTLERDFAAFRAGWFSRFYVRLELNDDERAARAGRFLTLLGSAIPATVTLALDELVKLEKYAPLPASELVPVLAPVTLARHKSTVKRCLKLLAAIAKREPAAKPEIARALVLALGHEAADVQKAALDMLDSIGDRKDSELLERLQVAAPGVVATLQKRVAAWVPLTEVAPPAPVPTPRVTERVSPFDLSRALEPLASLDELIFAFAHILEDDSDPMELERVLDGVTRFSGGRPADFVAKTSPLVKRAKKLADRGWDKPIVYCMACVALAWTAATGKARATFEEVVDSEWLRDPDNVGFGTLLLDRCLEVSGQLDTAPGAELVSIPTHRGGFLLPEVLKERLRRRPDPGELDCVLALLRVPENERKPLAKLMKSTPAIDFAASSAVRDSTWKVTVRKHDKYTFHDLVIECDPAPTGAKRADRPAQLLYQGQKYGKTAGWTRSLVAWAASVWPTGTEALFFDALPSLAGNLDWSGAEWENVAFYELVREPVTKLDELARLTLALGLATKEPGENGVSTDAAIAAIDQGRIDGRTLGETLAELRPTGLVNLKRWSRTLGIVARSSALHAAHVRTAIERCLRGDPKDAPRDEGALVDLLCELHAEGRTKISDPETWAYLSTSRHKKKTVELEP
jgi:hypothetical protein